MSYASLLIPFFQRHFVFAYVTLTPFLVTKFAQLGGTGMVQVVFFQSYDLLDFHYVRRKFPWPFWEAKCPWQLPVTFTGKWGTSCGANFWNCKNETINPVSVIFIVAQQRGLAFLMMDSNILKYFFSEIAVLRLPVFLENWMLHPYISCNDVSKFTM